jgi:hypothetical protein
MEVLFDETFATPDGKDVSRNLWYGYADISVDGNFGKDIHLTDAFADEVCAFVKKDLASDVSPIPTETNWYIYGQDTAKDAIGDAIRPTIMIRERENAFVVNINISDHDFALHIDEVLAFRESLGVRLGLLSPESAALQT